MIKQVVGLLLLCMFMCALCISVTGCEAPADTQIEQAADENSAFQGNPDIIWDETATEADERTRLYMVFSISLLILFSILLMFYARSQTLKKNFEAQAEATLEANKTLQVLIDFAPVSIIISRRGDGEILYANRSALDMFNYESFESVISRNSADYMPEYQPDGTLSIERIKDFWRHADDVTEIVLLKNTGEHFTARVAYRVINYYGTVASLNIVEDMTAEKERQKMLENIAQKEQDANQLKSRFLATMSHEIRTPMNAIIGLAELALREQEKSEIIDHVATIKQAGGNLLSILNDILDLSKIESGKMEIIEADYCVASMLHDLVSIIQMRLMDSPISFTVKADSSIPKTLHGDEPRVRQAVLNLLANAAKYTEKGYVSFGIYCEFVDDRNVNMIFEVKDTGIGIKQEDMDMLFEDFKQLEPERNKKVEGIGLGLSIARSFVSRMGGEITVESHYGKGSTFTIRLPQKYSSSDKLASVDSPGEKKALLYHRNEAYSSSIAYALADLGVDYELVKSGTELFKKMESNNFNYLFISHDLFGRNEETIEKFGKNTTAVVLTEFGKNHAGGRNAFVRDMSVLTMPVYCTAIADVLNGVYENASHTADGIPSDAVFSAPGVKVLVVDDIITNLKVAEGFLKAYKIKADLAESGTEALELMKKAADGAAAGKSGFYDLVFMDQKMPGMDGVETVKRMRSMGGVYKDVPVIALTANAVSGAADMFFDNGFNDFISKPIDTIKLGDILSKWIPEEKRE